MLDQLKQDVWQANLDLVTHGLVVLTWGNASGVDRERGVMVIKPSGVSYADMQPADMVAVDIATGETVEGDLRPSSDTRTHLALYRAWPAIGGAIHTHSIYATMFAQACRPLPCFGTTHADQFYGDVPVTRTLTPEEVDRDYEASTGDVIVERFAELDPIAVPAVLAANHGPFAWGKDVESAVTNAAALEAVAKMAVGALLINPGMGPIPQHIVDKHYLRKHGPGAYYGQESH
ncbi:L-ribulose-5-phosphate 4-epimerase AraD [bacterium]|nr:L-ribulose-5-phosphate 4-epimerase AraD [bacterium]